MSQYATITEADTYFESTFDSSAWDGVDELKNKALKMATRLIDQLAFSYDKTETTQELEFPRNDETTIPTSIKNACIEISYALMDGVDIELEYQNLRISSQGISNARLTYDRDVRRVHLECGIPSIVAWNYLQPYLRDMKAINFNRVS